MGNNINKPNYWENYKLKVDKYLNNFFKTILILIQVIRIKTKFYTNKDVNPSLQSKNISSN